MAPTSTWWRLSRCWFLAKEAAKMRQYLVLGILTPVNVLQTRHKFVCY